MWRTAWRGRTSAGRQGQARLATPSEEKYRVGEACLGKGQQAQAPQAHRRQTLHSNACPPAPPAATSLPCTAPARPPTAASCGSSRWRRLRDEMNTGCMSCRAGNSKACGSSKWGQQAAGAADAGKSMLHHTGRLPQRLTVDGIRCRLCLQPNFDGVCTTAQQTEALGANGCITATAREGGSGGTLGRAKAAAQVQAAAWHC